MNSDETNSFEKFPGNKGDISTEKAKQVEAWKEAMTGAPEFGGEGIGVFEESKSAGSGIGVVAPEAPKSAEVAENAFGIAKSENGYYGEAKSSGVDSEASKQNVSDSSVSQGASMNVVAPAEDGIERDDGIADAAALINYGLNRAAMQIGVEAVVQKIKGFDASGRENPIGDLFAVLEVDLPEGYKEKANASTDSVNEFRDGVNAPATQNKSNEGAFKALDDMKELISEVEGADPRYEELRQGAKKLGKGYFEYAVSNYGVQDLIQLFDELAKQREKAEDEESNANAPETAI